MTLPRLPTPWPKDPPPGPFRPKTWRSPIRGPWLASVLSIGLLVTFGIAAVTGWVSHAAYEYELGGNAIFPDDPILGWSYDWTWPSGPDWLYALNQGLHVSLGLAAIPLLIGKLWTVIPKLFEWPPLRSPAHALERLSLAALVGSSIFLLATGVTNFQLYYPFKFPFVEAHYYAAIAFVATLVFHVLTHLPAMIRAFRTRGALRPLRERLDDTRAEEWEEGHTSAPQSPAQTTVTRRGVLATLGAGSLGLGLMGAGQSAGGPLRPLAFLGPRGPTVVGDAPNAYPINKTARRANVTREMTGPGWRLRVVGARTVELSRDELQAMPQARHTMPIACVEGWSIERTWTGVRIIDLARLVDVPEPALCQSISLQPAGAFARVWFSAAQARDPGSLLALHVGDGEVSEPLSLDHGFPARMMVPAAPGVHQTKWMSELRFRA